MPLLSDPETVSSSATTRAPQTRKQSQQSQHSEIAKTAIMNVATPAADGWQALEKIDLGKSSLAPPSRAANGRACDGEAGDKDGVGAALTDTPASTAPNSPRM